MQQENRISFINSFRKGISDGIPIALGYLSVAFTFGMMATEGGLSAAEALLISMTNLTSAGQIAGLDVMLAGGTAFGNGVDSACYQHTVCAYVNIPFAKNATKAYGLEIDFLLPSEIRTRYLP